MSAIHRPLTGIWLGRAHGIIWSSSAVSKTRMAAQALSVAAILCGSEVPALSQSEFEAPRGKELLQACKVGAERLVTEKGLRERLLPSQKAALQTGYAQLCRCFTSSMKKEILEPNEDSAMILDMVTAAFNSGKELPNKKVDTIVTSRINSCTADTLSGKFSAAFTLFGTMVRESSADISSENPTPDPQQTKLAVPLPQISVPQTPTPSALVYSSPSKLPKSEDSKTPVTPPRLISKVEPEYSLAAKRKGVEGYVKLYFVVDTEGTPIEFRVMEGLGEGLDEKAVECVSKWRFAPATKDGRAVRFPP